MSYVNLLPIPNARSISANYKKWVDIPANTVSTKVELLSDGVKVTYDVDGEEYYVNLKLDVFKAFFDDRS